MEHSDIQIDILGINHYMEGNDLTGSLTKSREQSLLIRFKIHPDRENRKLITYLWKTDYCFDKASDKVEKEFPLTAEGLDAIKEYLLQEYRNL